jgi:hypothetical protein
MDCDCIGACPFFHDKMAMKPALAAVYKQRYCQGDFQACARHRVKDALGKPAVPADLFPNMEERALLIIKEARPA